jgi:hypothetical protein
MGRTSSDCVCTSTDSTAGSVVQLDTMRTCSSRGRCTAASSAAALRDDLIAQAAFLRTLSHVGTFAVVLSSAYRTHSFREYTPDG